MTDVATQTGAAAAAPALRLSGVTKRFGAVRANTDVELTLLPGEIHAVLGENGAGKSTLMGIVFGSVAPDAGTLEMDGRPLPWPSTREAIERGIGMVHQHFMIVPTLTVGENVLLSVMETAGGRRMRMADVARAIAEIGAEHDLPLDPRAPVDELSVGERLRLEIVKTLLQGRLRGGLRVFVLDEPTALLTRQEITRLFAVLRGLAASGTAVAIITHKLEEVMEATDRVTVLRDGHVVRTVETAATSPAQLAMLMVGRPARDARPERHPPTGEVVLSVEDLVVDSDGHRLLDGVSLRVHAGEIVGVAGVAGNGQDVLAECVSGLRRPTAGAIRLRDVDVTATSRRRLIEHELAHVPEDRRADGVVGEASIASNFILGQHRGGQFQRRGWLRRAAIRAHARRLTREFGVRSAGLEQPIDALSGGNQQRVILGRELHKAPPFVLASGPTRGIDIAGCEYIQQRLVQQRDAGAAVLLVSLDLDELLALSDRLVVMERGRVVGELRADEADPETLGLMMGGSGAAPSGGAPAGAAA